MLLLFPTKKRSGYKPDLTATTSTYSLAVFVRFSLWHTERILEGFLADGEGQVAAGFFQHAAHGIGGAAQAVGDGIREIQRYQFVVNIVHIRKEFLAAGKVAGAHFIQ